ncbi:DUF1365 domain-containing protein [Bdellovibrio sp. ZAP7]|uniref:DUF1365 domain-containing protein n=1 Tax=Bdellovibrio sp. ZAP7 TaxID=2231053 RepID=UPI00115962DE|nr:DUF1365 domain-containing protein [Bdellovibrio sp. ZAP7]QDK44594.1 DUF1365 domain-containing protein [Bdellovibrio sp. ZAP7]
MTSLQILKGNIYHSRNHQVRHSFRYPTFALLFSLRSESDQLNVLKRISKGSFSLKSEDYLHGHKSSFYEAITGFLSQECNYQAEEVILQTFPRMFGYAFNPVSFWYCKRKGVLEAVLCEVNNTFGERHFYWICPPGGIQASEFYRSDKVFHVSPFFPVDGFYKFRFQLDDIHSRVDIFYHDTNEKLRFSSWIEGAITSFEKESFWKLLLTYGWMTPLVVIRIHWQAFKLWSKRVSFYKKPVPPQKEIT